MCELLSLSEIRPAHTGAVGGKAARLAILQQLGFSVPAGFCIPVDWYERWLAAVGLPSDDAELALWREAVATTPLPAGLTEDVLDFCAKLSEGDGGARWAVRSSAVGEDGQVASWAGQSDSYVDVPTADVPARVRDCWLSLWSSHAVSYRDKQGGEAVMGVIVQRMLAPQVAGVAFSRDPVTGGREVVVEAVRGTGEGLTQGSVSPVRYVVPADEQGQRARWSRDGVLSATDLAAVAGLARKAEASLGWPVDVEWALAGEKVYLLQARPLTAVGGDDFYTTPAADDELWTAGFVNERFTTPVSPLGWSVVKDNFERLALREPLAYVGHPEAWRRPVTRLRHGHPYVAVGAVASLYKLLPDALLPEDAVRYFPQGRTELRRSAAYPRSWLEPRLWWAALRTLVREPANLSPLHNHREWIRTRRHYTSALDDIALALAATEDAHSLLALADRVQTANRTLLAVHRWSLTHADLWYSLLRRLARAWLGEAWQREVARLVRGADQISVGLDAELRRLAEPVAERRDLREAVAAASDLVDLAAKVETEDAGRSWLEQLRSFLAQYGHRSYSLDIRQPGFAAAPRQVFDLLLMLSREQSSASDGEGRPEGSLPRPNPVQAGSPLPMWSTGEDGNDLLQEAQQDLVGADVPVRPGGHGGPPLPPSGKEEGESKRARDVIGNLAWWKRLALGGALSLSRRYLWLREEQRFHWQRGLALLRQIYVKLGGYLAEKGQLDTREDVFFLTAEEIGEAVKDRRPAAEAAALARRRRKEFAVLVAEQEADPEGAYPPFLHGGNPLQTTAQNGREVLHGTPVSSGLAVGTVRVVRDPSGLADVQSGEVLVAPSVDPGWTPVFGKLAALVTECGGQLSHPAVVAREYGLPAVLAVPGATRRLRDGDRVLVDGAAGTVAPWMDAIGSKTEEAERTQQ